MVKVSTPLLQVLHAVLQETLRLVSVDTIYRDSEGVQALLEPLIELTERVEAPGRWWTPCP